MEFGLVLPPRARRTERLASMAEGMGFHTLLLTDSQNLAPEAWSHLMLAARATERIKLGTGVSNSITRDPAVTASAALSLSAESGGRAVLGIGRGDSAVQRIGKDLDPLASFERYVERVQGYLRGESVDRDGFESRIEWYRAVKQPKVPLQIAATGPKVIELAGKSADAVMLAVGADPDHVRAGAERARAAAAEAGRAPGELRVGAFVNALVHDDVEVARDAIRGTAATFARFSSFKGSPIAALPGPLQKAATFLKQHYDMKDHTRDQAEHARAMENDFIDWFAIAGPLDHVRERFSALASLGLDFVYLVGASGDTPREVASGSLKAISTEIIPAFGG